MDIEFVEVKKYSERYCNCCGEHQYGEFMVLPNDYKICQSCLDTITKEIKINEFRKSLN